MPPALPPTRRQFLQQTSVALAATAALPLSARAADPTTDRLRAGKIPNDGDRLAQSTLMGRMSAYTGKEVTWQQALDSKLDTMPKNLAWDMKLEVPPPPSPAAPR